MCLGIPTKIVEIVDEEMAIVEVDGVKREISLLLTPDAKVGDYVIVHAGFAIQILDRTEAEDTLTIFTEMAEKIQRQRERVRKKRLTDRFN